MELLFATASLLAVTMAASFIYYRRIKQAQGEYEGAKDLVKNITLSFSNQISRVKKSLEQINDGLKLVKQSSMEALKVSNEALDTAKEGMKETRRLTEKVKNTEKAVESMKKELMGLTKSYRPTTAKTQMEAPIPVKKDAILERLTGTELEVLAIIEEEGEGSVPEIRERIKKTREHTARLLKKLYDRGYIDRNTSSMPYKYYIRKEIIDIIKQQREKMKIAV